MIEQPFLANHSFSIRDPVCNIVRHVEQQSEPVGDKNKDY